jgi:hypothetical protein
MTYALIPLADLVVNPANDRHGELTDESAAIAQLFAEQEPHMKNLAKDLAAKGTIYEPPLIYKRGSKYIVADGNRRTTCLKLLASPRRAPTTDLQEFFAALRQNWVGKFPDQIECRVESDRDRVDDILYRRHTGVQGGVGQSTWTDRMKKNFVIRTGKSSGVNVADEIEKRLQEANLLPGRQIPRSNLNRLLSGEALRNRTGISVRKGKLEFIRDEVESLRCLQRIANDLAERKVTLDDVWDTERKLEYLDKLDGEGVLPSISGRALKLPTTPAAIAPAVVTLKSSKKAQHWPHLIPDLDYGVIWSGHLQRHREIWIELQHKLELGVHSNAISVLLRVLLELSVDNYITRSKITSVQPGDKLARKVEKVAIALHDTGKIDKKYLGAINKLQQGDAIISIDTMNRYVHSPNFNVSPEHLKMIWATLSQFIVRCLDA